MQILCNTAIAADRSAVLSWTPTPTFTSSNTPTITPTSTALPVPVLKGSTFPISTYGNSHCSVSVCEAAGLSLEGWSRAFLAAANHDGYDGYYVGAHLNQHPTPEVQDHYTDCVGGERAAQAYQHMLSTLHGEHPSNNGLIIIMAVGNDGFDPYLTRQQSADFAYAAITLSANVTLGCPGCYGILTNDFAVAYGITPSVEADVIAGQKDGYDRAWADGYHQFCFLDTSAEVQNGYSLCSDASHLADSSMNRFGAFLWNSSKAFLGY